MNHETDLLSDALGVTPEIISGESLPKPEDLLKKWEVKSKPVAELVKFFRGNTNSETLEVLENRPFRTFRIAGLALKKVDGDSLFMSIKEWHPKDHRIPTENCFLTVSIYKGKDYYNSWNVPDFRLQVDHDSKEVLPCNQSLNTSHGRVPSELASYLREIENYFEDLNKNYFSLT